MILLVGGGGIPNYGDELIINNWLRWYGEVGEGAMNRVRVEGYSARVLRSTFSSRFPEVGWGHIVRNARLRYRDAGFWGALDGGLKAGEASDRSVRAAKDIADAASIFHVHGGGYINGKWPTHAFVLGIAASAAKSAGTRAVATGLGLRPVPEPDDLERAILDEVVGCFSLLEVRDKWSYDFLIRNVAPSNHSKIILGLDDAFLQPVLAERRDTRTLHLALRADAAGDSIIERLDNDFVGSFDRHQFWVCKPADAAAFAKLAEKFRFFELAGTTQLVENLHLSSQDILITERFHPHLQAARAGAGGVYWSGSDYYDTKHGSLVELGSPFVKDDGNAFAIAALSGNNSSMKENDADYLRRKRAIARMILS